MKGNEKFVALFPPNLDRNGWLGKFPVTSRYLSLVRDSLDIGKRSASEAVTTIPKQAVNIYICVRAKVPISYTHSASRPGHLALKRLLG
jgi:hypothetical protein